MPRYHYDLVNPKTIEDQVELPGDIEAIDSADEMARQLLDARPYLKNRQYAILVTNEDGNEISRLSLDINH